MRRGLGVILLAALTCLLAIPAQAAAPLAPVPTGVINTGYGRTSFRVFHPTRADWYATVTFDTHLGYVGGADQDADAGRAAVQLANGPGVTGTRVDKLRFGFEGRVDLAVDDYRPHAPAFRGGFANSNNGLLPADPLSSTRDFEPDAKVMNARTDWVDLDCSYPRVRPRSTFAVWYADGRQVIYDRWGNFIIHDNNGCAPAPAADLEISISDQPDPVLSGQELTYTVRVVNNGPNTASGVRVLIDTDNRLEDIAGTFPGGTCTVVDIGTSPTPDPGLRCDLGGLADDEVVVITVTGTATVPASGAAAYETVADVASTSSFADTDFDVELTTVVAAADLALTKTALDGDPLAPKTSFTAPDDSFIYRLVATNNGPNGAAGTTLIDTWPVGLDAPADADAALEGIQVDADALTAGYQNRNCNYDPASREITCAIGNFAAGASVTLNLAARTNASAPATGNLSNQAVVDATTADPNEANNLAIVNLPRATTAA